MRGSKTPLSAVEHDRQEQYQVEQGLDILNR